VLQLRSHDPYSYLDRGCVYLAMKDFEKAIRDFDEAIQFKPHFAEAFYQRALAHLQQNNRDSAEADLDTAEKLAKGSYPGQKPLKMEKTDLIEKIMLARDQLRKCAAR
jgi:tetratricopeptide (TPR) repeat protein